MYENIETLISRRSSVQVLFRALVVGLVIESVWFLLTIQTYRSTMNIITTTEDFNEHIALTEGADKMFIIASVLALTALLFVGWYCYTGIAKLRNRPIILSTGGITPEGGNDEIEFSAIGSIVFSARRSEADSIIMEGLLVPAENKPNTSLEEISLFAEGKRPESILEDSEGEGEYIAAIKGFHLHTNNEAFALELAKRFILANKEGKVLSIVNKFHKQRVVLRAGKG